MKNIGILLLMLTFACTPKKNKEVPSESAAPNYNEITQAAETTTSAEEKVEKVATTSWRQVEVQKTALEGYHTQFVNGDKGLLYSKENFEGLWYYDLEAKSSVLITDQAGAGFQPKWVDGNIVYQVKARMKYLESFDFDKKKRASVEENKKSLTPARYARENTTKASASLTKDLLGIEIISASGEKTIIQPQSDGNYISASLSPSGNRLLYEVAGLGGFVAGLSGNTILELGNVDAPKWITNNQIVYGESQDDGMQILGSKVFVFDLQSETKMQLKVDEESLFEPSVSQDGKQISAHSSEGDIFIFNQK